MAEGKHAFLIINVDLPMYLTLNPNPESMDISTKKVYSKTQTIGGWVFEHRGAEPDIMKVSGVTPAIIDIPDYINNTILTTRQVKVETYLVQLQQLVKLDKERVINFAKGWKKAFSSKAADVISLAPTDKALKNKISNVLNDKLDIMTLARTLIYYKGTIYFGFFDSFSYTETPDRFYKYNFQYVIVQSSTDYIIGQLMKADGILRTFLASNLPATVGAIRVTSL